MSEVGQSVSTWAEHDYALARIATEMTGAAIYFADHPDYATDENVAQAFREYAERMARVERPS